MAGQQTSERIHQPGDKLVDESVLFVGGLPSQGVTADTLAEVECKRDKLPNCHSALPNDQIHKLTN
eukprot:scaffold401470_cov16-Prasinocladus_malaysianus.AAC.1